MTGGKALKSVSLIKALVTLLWVRDRGLVWGRDWQSRFPLEDFGTWPFMVRYGKEASAPDLSLVEPSSIQLLVMSFVSILREKLIPRVIRDWNFLLCAGLGCMTWDFILLSQKNNLVSCLKQSILIMFTNRLNNQILLRGCTAVGMPLASVWTCGMEATAHLRMHHPLSLPFLSSVVLSTESCRQT